MFGISILVDVKFKAVGLQLEELIGTLFTKVAHVYAPLNP